jgi:hypothetical protein
MAFALALELPAHVNPPALVAPASREASFGRISGTVQPGTYRVVVKVNGRGKDSVQVDGKKFELQVDLPPRDATIEVVAEDALGNSGTTRIQKVLGLPAADAETAESTHEDASLAAAVDELVDGFPAMSAVYVENLQTGAGAAWNATARFPAASTVKLAIAIETLRILSDRPEEGTELDVLLRDMLVDSDNEAANELLRWIGSTDEGGAEQVNRTLGALDLEDSHLYGAFLIASTGPPIPLETESEPEFVGKYTSAWDLAQLYRFVHLAAQGEGPLLDLEGTFEASDARAILWFLAHSSDHGKIDRLLGKRAIVAHKAGWLSDARHDAGLVYTPRGAFIAVVMTYTGGGAGESSDLLAARVARAVQQRLGDTSASPAPSASSS